MSVWLVGLCTVAYFVTSIDLYLKGQVGHAVMFAAYGVANIGLIAAIRGY